MGLGSAGTGGEERQAGAGGGAHQGRGLTSDCPSPCTLRGHKGLPPNPMQDSRAFAPKGQASGALMAVPMGPRSRTQNDDRKKPVPRRGRGAQEGSPAKPELPCPNALAPPGGCDFSRKVPLQNRGGRRVQTRAEREKTGQGVRKDGDYFLA